MTSTLLTILFAAAALLFALALAFLPLRILVFSMAKSVRGTVNEWVQRRRRDRRTAPRETSERRTAPPPYVAPRDEANRRTPSGRRGSGDRRTDERRDEPQDAPESAPPV